MPPATQRDPAAVPDEQLEEARRNARFTYAQRRIQKIVDGAPPLSAEQRQRLALLLAPASAAADGEHAA
jgi:hypothetical protein